MPQATGLGLARVGEGECEGSTPPTISVGADADVAAEVADSTGTVAQGKQRAASSAAAEPAVAVLSATPARATRVDSLRQAAQALLDAWAKFADSDHAIVNEMNGPVAGLRAALVIRPCTSASTDGPSQPRDTKQARILAMRSREDGASGPQIAEAMGWAPHTVRGYLAGLAKKGFNVDVLERVRQVGPNKVGAKGSYTVYRLAATAGE